MFVHGRYENTGPEIPPVLIGRLAAGKGSRRIAIVCGSGENREDNRMRAQMKR
jgi:hypothetical protein